MGDTPVNGDRVRFIVEGEYIRPVTNHKVSDHVVLAGAGDEYTLPHEAVIEILERADDPAKDPVGTVRRFGDAETPIVWVKTDRDEWQRTPRQGIRSTWRDRAMLDSGVIGTAPGTPAAAAAEKPEEPEYEYYQGNINYRYYRVKGDRVDILNGRGWTNVAGTVLAASADLIRSSGRWTKLDGKPSDVD